MIDKLNGVQFTGKAAKNLPAQKTEKENKQEQPKQVVVVSKDGAKALRNYAMGILALLGAAAATPSLTSCSKEDFAPDMEFNHKDSLVVNVDYHPIPQDPDTFIVTVPEIIRDTIFKTDTVFQDRPIYLPGDTIHETDTIIQKVPIYLPGDTIRDTIKVEIPGEIVYVKPDYESEVADSLIQHGHNLGLDMDGDGKIPTRIHAFDQWNSVDHDLVFDGKASSYETMVFIDRKLDYSKDSKNPTLNYSKAEFSVDYGKGVTFEYFDSRYPGSKPNSKNDWIPTGKVCLTNLRNGFIQRSVYDENGNLVNTGSFEKGDPDVSFYENLISPSGYVDSYAWSEAKMYRSNPEK